MYTHFDAVIFDLDGVITNTAAVHSKAWKNMFDEYLIYRQEEYGEEFTPFSHEEDYLRYVDGKPRYKGVESFLQSRDIHIPQGDPADDPREETICGLGNRKNVFFNRLISDEGVEVFQSSLDLIYELIDAGIRTGVATSSRNAETVLESAGIAGFFGARVDGKLSEELNLAGKPEPDIFLKATEILDCVPARTVIFEDAVSGVMAGRKGNFGLVVGIARENNEEELKNAGAHIVISDVEELGGVRGIEAWFIRTAQGS